MSIGARNAITEILSHASGARHEFILSTLKGSHKIGQSEAEAELRDMIKKKLVASKAAGEGENKTTVYWLTGTN